MDFGLLVCVDKGCYHSFYFLLLLFSLIAVSVPLRGKYRGESFTWEGSNQTGLLQVSVPLLGKYRGE